MILRTLSIRTLPKTYHDSKLDKLHRIASTAAVERSLKDDKPAKHLNYADKTNLGSFYTPQHIVAKVYELLEQHNVLANVDVVLEPSCGYGAFLHYPFTRCQDESRPTATGLNRLRIIAADVDNTALQVAEQEYPNVSFYQQNALHKVSRRNYGIADNEKVLIIGNPPYNDKTSQIKIGVKTDTDYPVDTDIQARDIGLSSLLAYVKLEPEYIAVLHPLSYLIKKTNFGILRRLLNKYRLIDALVFSSQEFADTSKHTGFPIMIAVYQRHVFGTTFSNIASMRFPTLEGKYFSLNQFDYVDNYLQKYPGKDKKSNFHGYLFYTLRDINALKRSRTFINEDIPNAVQIQQDKLPYYHYVDVFKDYIEQLPYYMGNMSIPIDNALFCLLQNDFILLSKAKHPGIFSNSKVSAAAVAEAKRNVGKYFQQLFNNR